MAKAFAVITFIYEMDETDETDIPAQMVVDQDDLRKMVNSYFLDIRNKPEDLDVAIQIV